MNNQVFVGIQKVNLLDFKELLKNESLDTDNTYYFLRWVNQVEGFCPGIPDKLGSDEGQIFTPQLELRWDRKGEVYNLLLLSIIGNIGRFKVLKPDWDWICQTRTAHAYAQTETRFPRMINAQHLEIKQRYFMEKKTSTVHFTALTIQKKDD